MGILSASRTQLLAVSENARNNTGHYPVWEEDKFIDRDRQWYSRRVNEVIHIRPHPNNINRDTGIEIPEEWMLRSDKIAADRYRSGLLREQFPL